MKYTGPLYAKMPGTRKYVKLREDSVYVDNLETKLAEARAEIESLKLSAGELNGAFNARPKCEKCKDKDKLIEQMQDALVLILEGAIHDFHYVCQHRDNCLCWGCQKKRVKAALAAEREEK